ncbi:hypothetical protein [Parasitella parasitica]|uniref:Uncharacterized protein n=1 Tax=Parasitella parasitica TaxID=35722 RepID=A0A0B7N7V1_9FUNG|nr:hypothetical protein [Parasitella parasitica]
MQPHKRNGKMSAHEKPMHQSDRNTNEPLESRDTQGGRQRYLKSFSCDGDMTGRVVEKKANLFLEPSLMSRTSVALKQKILVPVHRAK